MELQALETLNSWLAARGHDTSSSTEDTWNISPYRDGFVFSPSGAARSNLLYIVSGDDVGAFSPATTSIDEAYAQVGGERRAPEATGEV
jgi:hypothetical protein